MSEVFSHPIPAMLGMLGLIIIVHEAGHYLVGKAFGLAVETFSVGVGPRLFGFRFAETDFRISVLPLGGYVKFAGALPSDEVPEQFVGRELWRAPRFARIAMLAAGPLANLFLAVAIYGCLGWKGIDHPPP